MGLALPQRNTFACPHQQAYIFALPNHTRDSWCTAQNDAAGLAAERAFEAHLLEKSMLAEAEAAERALYSLTYHDALYSLTYHDTASHIMAHLQSPPAHRTVHLLNLRNVHYEATSLPESMYPIIADSPPSARHVRGVSQSAQHLPSSASSLPGSQHETLSLTTSASDATASVPDLALPRSKTTDRHPAPIHRPPIQEYCGLVLNSQSYFRSILDKVKIYEVRTTSKAELCPRILFHPCKAIRDSGYTQNIEARISPFQHEKMIRTAKALLDATHNGKDLGLTEEETKRFVAAAKAKSSSAVFYLYLLSEPKESEIEWLDHPLYNQFVFSTPQYTTKKTNAVVTLFRWPQCTVDEVSLPR